ncbi:MAG: glycosyltransferase, partial [Anaerolineales bacterium]
VGIRLCDRMLLFVGRIEPLKGIDSLIKALAIMNNDGVDVCLAVIGGDADTSLAVETEEMGRLKSMREQVGRVDLVTFMGKRSQDSLPYYYSAAEAVVVPSHYESFGMVALEAMACGTPVVASQVGGLAFLVQDGVTGYTVPVDEPQALAERLTELINNPELRLELGANAAAFARDYSWEKIAGRIVELYQDVIEKMGGKRKTPAKQASDQI